MNKYEHVNWGAEGPCVVKSNLTMGGGGALCRGSGTIVLYVGGGLSVAP